MRTLSKICKVGANILEHVALKLNADYVEIGGCDSSAPIQIPFTIIDSQWHTFRVEELDGEYSVLLDGQEVASGTTSVDAPSAGVTLEYHANGGCGPERLSIDYATIYTDGS